MKQTTKRRLSMSAACMLAWSSVTATVHAHGSEANLIHACVKKSGALRIISSTATCKANETPLDWHSQGPQGSGGFPITCPADSVPVGTTCVDKYEASVWQIPSGSTALIDKVKNGAATLAELQAGAVQKGTSFDDYTCNNNGNDCTNLYAVSLSGITPAMHVTWFQAQQFCRVSGKRLLTNAEWQAAAAGTPDGAPCVVSASSVQPTGTPGCDSNAGAFDMVGNLYEWVGDWMQANTDNDAGAFSSANYGLDWIAGIDEAFPGTDRLPAALLRGGGFSEGNNAGVFALHAGVEPSYSLGNIGGFRCAR